MKPEDLVKKIQNEAPTVRVVNEKLGIDAEYWVVEGDVRLSKAGLLPYARYRLALAAEQKERPSEFRRGLIAVESEGKILRWAPGKVLEYCVWRPSFGSDAEYQSVVDGMVKATADWMAVCGVTFEHRSNLDTKENLRLGEALFPVLRTKGGGSTVAMAFFPNEPVKERVVHVFDGYFSGSGFDPVGVLRHELGHVLGFRHEHIAPEAPEIFAPEPIDHIIRLTKYDPTSVMHYVAPGVGDAKLELTTLDRVGAARVYGAPFADFKFAQ